MIKNLHFSLICLSNFLILVYVINFDFIHVKNLIHLFNLEVINVYFVTIFEILIIYFDYLF